MKQNETQWIERLSAMAAASCQLDSELYVKYDVKRGLRDINGKGVRAGLTQIGDVQSHPEGDETGPGHLIYRGIDIDDLVAGFLTDGRPGFEETTYLLLAGELPNREELNGFCELLGSYRGLPDSFVHDSLLKLTSRDMMNAMAQSILAMYILDDQAEDVSLANVLRQCLKLIAVFPLLAAYSYQAYTYFYGKGSLVIHSPQPELSTAANLLLNLLGMIALIWSNRFVKKMDVMGII